MHQYRCVREAPTDPRHLIKHRRPTSLGGTGQDPVWYIEEENLPAGLMVRMDRSDHALIEPLHPMPLQEYEGFLTATRPLWKLFCR
jgi:hypothetical protein